MSIEKLTTILPVPENNGVIVDWADVGKAIHFELPEDYKQFIELYGLGWIDDFMLVLSPDAEHERYNLLEGGQKRLYGYMSNKESAPSFYLHDALKNGNGIYPWGLTDNADTLYWQIVDGKVESIVIYNARGGDHFSTDLGFSDFLYAILNRNLVTDRLPEDFPSASIVFIEQWKYDQGLLS